VAGIGAVIAGMTGQGFNVEVRQFPEGWRANFYPAGVAHSVVCGSAWQPTPGRAGTKGGVGGAEQAQRSLVPDPVAGQ
jgi:hypothetical protein